ncbi:hypothetical protein F5888DRAFT_1109126 [Russula emetica]|nr:hypothetical protein F5888DRAFT_1109126 [Russula emetica]
MRGGMSPSWTRTGQNQEYPGEVDPPKNELPVAILSEIGRTCAARPGTRGRQVCPASAPLHLPPCSSLYLYHSSSICRRPWLCRCLCHNSSHSRSIERDGCPQIRYRRCEGRGHHHTHTNPFLNRNLNAQLAITVVSANLNPGSVMELCWRNLVGENWPQTQVRL